MTNNIKLIGVVGAGQMGLGIAQVFATSGFDVLINDNNKISLSNSSEVIKANLKKAINKGRLHKNAGISSVKKIKSEFDISQLGKCDLIIEAATEDEKIKH